MKIEIAENFCIRLGEYAAKNNLKSFSEAMGHLLDKESDGGVFHDTNKQLAFVSYDPLQGKMIHDYEKQGLDLREQAKTFVLDFLGSVKEGQPGESGISQTNIFRKCGLDWGDFPLAKSNNQVSWLNALMWQLEEEGKVERNDTNWRLTKN